MRRLATLSLAAWALTAGGCLARRPIVRAPPAEGAASPSTVDGPSAQRPGGDGSSAAPAMAEGVLPAAPASARPALSPQGDSKEASASGADDEEAGDESSGQDDGEVHEGASSGGELAYTADLSDEQLAEAWKGAPESLGSISVGYADEGRLINAERFPEGDGAWLVVSPDVSWATNETIDYVTAAIRRVREQFPNCPPLRVNQLSLREGGFVRPHRSHQSGRDVDLGFYYPTVDPVQVREREKVIDVALNWALVKALVTLTDVQVLLVDRRIQKVLYAHALAAGEDQAWLDRLFNAGNGSLIQHARRHRDHFHVRFYNPRAQELGRRVAPLLAQRPEHNLAMHRVRSGDTLGALALRYNSTVAAIQKANQLRGTFLRVAQVLKVPLRGPCVRCPVPPPLVPAPRLLPKANSL